MKKTSLISVVILVILVAVVLLIEIRDAYAPSPSSLSQISPVSIPAHIQLSQVYINSSKKYSVRYPTGFTLNQSYVYQSLGPNKDIHGVKFTIPSTLAVGTNLGPDSYVSVEQMPTAKTCDASYFVDPASSMKPTTVVDHGVTYSMTTASDAGAGNRYEETVYAISGTSPCTAVRYFIHYAAIENYTPGAVTEFNKQALVNEFDQIRRTVVIQK